MGKQREKVQAKNSLESYCFNMKSTMDEEKVKSAISDSEKKTITDKCDECIKWLDTTRLQRRMNTRTNRKSWSRSSTQSSRSCMLEELVVYQVVVCLVEPLVDPLPPPVVLALPSRRWTDLLPYRRRARPVLPVTSHWILGLYCQSPVIGS